MRKCDRRGVNRWCWGLVAALHGIAVLALGCETSSLVTTSPVPAKCSPTLPAQPALDAAGGTSSFTITTDAECAWNASSATDWISDLSPASGQGSATVRFRVSANQGPSAREGEIIVGSERLRLSQRAPCRYDVEPSSQNVSAVGATLTITIAASADCDWTATTTASWIALAEPVSGSGNGTVRFTVASNGGAERTGSVVVGGQQTRVTQAGNSPAPGPSASCSYSVGPGNQDIGAAGGGATITVSTSNGCPWGASSNASWIAVTSGTSGNGSGTVAISVSGNTGGARTGALTIAGQTATVTQAACTYAIAPTTQSIGGAGGSATPVAVTTLSTCQWSASTSTPWLSVTSGAAGTGNGAVGISAAANTGTARTGTLTIAGRTATVEQAAGCEYRISPTDQTVAAGGGGGVINVTAPSGCQWASRSNASWIAIQSGVTGSGSGRVEYSVESNSGASRTGTVAIADQSFTVTQQASTP